MSTANHGYTHAQLVKLHQKALASKGSGVVNDLPPQGYGLVSPLPSSGDGVVPVEFGQEDAPNSFIKYEKEKDDGIGKIVEKLRKQIIPL